MAVLNKIRKRSVFLIVIIALALFSFVLADLIRNQGFSSQKSQSVIGEVNGEQIDRQDFAKKVETTARSFGPGGNLRAANYVWDQEVRNLVLDEQFEELGLSVQKDQINARLEQNLATSPQFQDEAGNFSRAKLQEYIANAKATSQAAYDQWLQYEKSVADQVEEDLYFNMVKAGVAYTLKEGERAYRAENDKVGIQYVHIPYTTVKDEDVTVTDNEINAYIKAHPKEFKSEKARNIRYVSFAEEASDADKEELKAELSELLKDRVEYNSASKTNDSVKGFESTNDIKAFMDENSEIPFDDRFVFKKDLPQTYADTLYNLNEGQVFGPYEDEGYIKLTKMIAQKQMPDSVQASHILISWQGLQTETDSTRTKEQAKELADSVFGVVKKNKKKFEELAAEFSADQSNKDKGGDLGYFTPGRMVPAFNDYVFEGKTGDMGIVETQFGYHIISIEDQKNPQKAVKVATVGKPIESSEKTINDTYATVTKFEIAAGEGDFEEVAKGSNYEVKPVENLKELDENIPGIGNERSIVRWAFDEKTEVGDIKQFDTKEGYVVVQLTDKIKEGLMNAEQASSLVKPILLKEKKAEKIIATIKGGSLDEIAKNNNTTVKTTPALTVNNPFISGVGDEPKVVGRAYALEKGKMSKPIAGEKGVFVIQQVSKTEATSLDSYRGFAQKESQSAAGLVNNNIIDALKEKAEIEDKRAVFY